VTQSPAADSDVLSLLGLARRAGKVAAGTDRSRQALGSRAAKLVLIAADASPVQRRKLEGLIRRGTVPHVVIGDRAALGAAVGAPPLSAVAVTDARFAEQMLRRLANATPADS
jgi:ribosomal protein L7Ae-like RNA K-turn-binding protein